MPEPNTAHKDSPHAASSPPPPPAPCPHPQPPSITRGSDGENKLVVVTGETCQNPTLPTGPPAPRGARWPTQPRHHHELQYHATGVRGVVWRLPTGDRVLQNFDLHRHAELLFLFHHTNHSQPPLLLSPHPQLLSVWGWRGEDIMNWCSQPVRCTGYLRTIPPTIVPTQLDACGEYAGSATR